MAIASPPKPDSDRQPATMFGPSPNRTPHFGFSNAPRFGGLKRLAGDEKGAGAIEYGLLAALISLAIVSGLGEIGDKLDKTFDDVAEYLGFDDGGNGKGKGKGKGKGNGNGNGQA